MRRIALMFGLVALAAGSWVVAGAAAGDSHTYKVELDNAFGLVPGADVRVAGVTAGSIKGLDVNAAKRAVVTIEVSGPFSDFRADATCSSEPQSLIAEYFIDCQPGHAPQKSNGFIPVKNTTTTVPNDLLTNVLRGSYAQRFQLILNEFGTALAGNPKNLNDAIRRGAPALRSLRKALDIVGKQNKIIRDQTANSDEIIAKLTENRANIIRFIHTANRTAEISVSRRSDLQRNFHLLPQFLAELRPTLIGLGAVAEQGTPLMTSLNGSASQLNRLVKLLPPFNDATKPALTTLGDASVVGRRAVNKAEPIIKQLNRAGVNAKPTAKIISDLLQALGNRKRAAQEDKQAHDDNCNPTPQAQLPAGLNLPSVPPQCASNPKGYTALEGILNYGYYQTTSTSQFDTLGHMLHISFYNLTTSPCSPFGAAMVGTYMGQPGVPNKTGSAATTDPDQIHNCVAWLGRSQPGINEPDGVGPYSKQVCPLGSQDLSICNPSVDINYNSRSARNNKGPTTTQQGGQAGGGSGDKNGLGGLLNLPGNLLNGGSNNGARGGSGGDAGTATDLLDFLFGS